MEHSLTVPEATHELNWQERTRGLQYFEALDNMAVDPPGKEPAIAAFAQAETQALKRGPDGITEWQSSTGQFLRTRPEMSAEAQVNLKLRVVQFHVGPTPGYPFVTPEDWHTAIKKLTDDPEKMEDVDKKLGSFMVMTNEPNRAAGVLLGSLLFEDRMPDSGARILDLGCSVGLVLAQLKTKALPAHFPHIADHDTSGEKLEPAVKRRLMTLFGGRLAMGKSWGIDLSDHDFLTMGWVIPACQYPSEYANKEKQQQLKKLTNLRYFQLREMGVRMFKGDFNDPYAMEDFAAEVAEIAGTWQADILTSQTSWYQYAGSVALRAELSDSIVRNRKFLQPDGIEVRQEHAKPDEVDPDKIHLTSLYGPDAEYNLLIRDKQNPAAGYQTYLKLDGGRLNKCVVAPALLERLGKTGKL